MSKWPMWTEVNMPDLLKRMGRGGSLLPDGLREEEEPRIQPTANGFTPVDDKGNRRAPQRKFLDSLGAVIAFLVIAIVVLGLVYIAIGLARLILDLL